MTAENRVSLERLARSVLGDFWFPRFADIYVAMRESRDARFRKSLRRLAGFGDKHLNERCFIIGNGPSLNQTDLTLLKNEKTLGLNRIYLLFDRIGFATTYMVSVNRLVIEQCATDIERLPCPKFISWHARDAIKFTPDMMFLYSRGGPAFYPDVRQGVWEGATVTYVAMQLAYFMGFQEVILVGVDHSFAIEGKPHTAVISAGDDPNHFDPQYFGKGFKWQLPDLETSELAYRIARYQFELSGRRILDATVGGKLDVFPKVDYRSLFA